MMSPKRSRGLTVDVGGIQTILFQKVQDGTGRPINKQSTVEYERETKKESPNTRKGTKYGKSLYSMYSIEMMENK